MALKNLMIQFGLPLVLLSTPLFAANIVEFNDVSESIVSSFFPHGIKSTHNTSLKHISKVESQTGKTHIKYQQTLHGLPLLGFQVIKHELSGKPSVHNGAIVTEIESILPASMVKTLDLNIALEKLKSYHAKQKGKLISDFLFKQEKSQLAYVLDKNQEVRLVYYLSFFAEDTRKQSPERPVYLIDVKTNQLINTWDALTTKKVGMGPGGNEKIGQYEYGVDFDPMDVQVGKNTNLCEMKTRNVKTIDLESDTWSFGKKPFKFECFYQDSDPVNGAFSPLNDAHFFGGVIFDMYKNWYGSAPLQHGLTLKVHYGEQYENAFWDGKSMSFGDGGDYFYPLVSLDVVAHEVSHGFTEQHSDLSYYGQSGGINESFSDMAGKAAEFFMRGSNSWGLGSDITKFGEPLRYMDLPSQDGRSIDSTVDYYEGLDVHYSSGIFNKAFYHLATTPGWNTKVAFDAMVEANSHYWIPSSNFESAAFGVISAAKDLNLNVNDVIQAFEKVGIACSMTECLADIDEDPYYQDDDWFDW